MNTYVYPPCAKCGQRHSALILCPPKVGRPTTDGKPAIGHIHLRVTLRRKSAYVGAAIPKTLAAWMTEHLDRAAHYTPEKGENV